MALRRAGQADAERLRGINQRPAARRMPQRYAVHVAGPSRIDPGCLEGRPQHDQAELEAGRTPPPEIAGKPSKAADPTSERYQSGVHVTQARSYECKYDALIIESSIKNQNASKHLQYNDHDDIVLQSGIKKTRRKPTIFHDKICKKILSNRSSIN